MLDEFDHIRARVDPDKAESVDMQRQCEQSLAPLTPIELAGGKRQIPDYYLLWGMEYTV